MTEPNPNNNNAPDGARAWSQAGQADQDNKTTSPMPSISSSAIANCSACEYGAERNYGGHAGVDIVAPNGTVVVSPIGGRVKYADSNWYTPTSGGSTGRAMVGVVSDYASGGFPAGTLFASGHLNTIDVGVGARVEPGTRLGTIGTLSGTNHNHFYIYDYNKPNGDAGPDSSNGNVDPTPWVRAVMNGESVPTTGAPSGASLGAGGGLNESTAKAAAFATYFHIDGLTERLQSDLLTGEHSLMNDRPLFPFIQQLCAASLRRFQSLPNGDFFAFYPDYFGGANHRTAYWEINDIEIIDGQIELNDDQLATHVFVVGDTSEVSFFNGIDLIDELNSVGAINLFNAFQADFITGHKGQKRPEDKMLLSDLTNAEEFLRKYGARPYYEEAPMVRSTFFEAFLAYQKFCLLWSQQFATTFSLTFMPELFPGGLVRFPTHNLQMFIEEVTHTFDMETGFATDVVFSSPSSLNGDSTVHEGMIRSGVLDE